MGHYTEGRVWSNNWQAWVFDDQPKGYKYDDLEPGDTCPECLDGDMELQGLPGGEIELCCDNCGWGEE